MESHSYLALEKPAATEENTMTMGQQAQVRSIWGANEARMQAAKRLFDPKGVFTTNIPGV
jgi:FAD/FMN-containing dehydrogenase